MLLLNKEGHVEEGYVWDREMLPPLDQPYKITDAGIIAYKRSFYKKSAILSILKCAVDLFVVIALICAVIIYIISKNERQNAVPKIINKTTLNTPPKINYSLLLFKRE